MNESFSVIMSNAINRCNCIKVEDGMLQSIYPFTTENISGYIDKFNLKVCCSKNVAEKLGIHNFIVNLPNICKIAQNKYNNGEFLNVDKLEPLYLRASQAEIEREKKLKNGNKI